MQLGICCGIGLLAEARAAGFDFAEIPTAALLPGEDEAAFARIREAVTAISLPIAACNCFLPGHLKVTGPAVDIAAVRAHMDTVLRRAAALGARVMVFGSGAARRAPDGFPLARARGQLLEAIRLAGELAARYDMTLALEPLEARECNLLNLVNEGVRLLAEVHHPHVGLLADSYHMAAAGEPFFNLLTAGGQLTHVHIDMPNLAAGTPHYFPEFFTLLEQSGYSRRVSIENHTFTPASGEEVGAYYAGVRAFLGRSFGLRNFS